MAASEAGDRGTARGHDPLEQYVRQLLRDADRTRRAGRLRTRRFEAPDSVGESLIEMPQRLPRESAAADDFPPAG